MAEEITDITSRNLTMFFYVNGSKDYPTGHIVSDKFGYDPKDENDNVENAIFKYSIKDLYNRLSSPRVVNDSYGIRFLDNAAYTGVSQTAGVEPQSTMIIEEGTKESYNIINPNYEIDLGSTAQNRTRYLSILNGEKDGEVNYRERIFWNKIMRIAELLREKQSEIANNSLMGYGSTYFHLAPGMNLSEQAMSHVVNKNTFNDQLLTMFVGNKSVFGDDTVDTSREMADVTSIRAFRRMFEFSGLGTEDEPDFRVFDSNGLAASIQDNDGEFKGTYNNTVQPLWSLLDIQYQERSASYSVSAEHLNRLDSVTFSISFKDTLTSQQVWNITIYFTPDAIIENMSKGEFAVYTYNDDDMDDAERYAVQDRLAGFNIYDNDYANTLDRGLKHGRFIMKGSANNTYGRPTGEFDDLVMKKIFEITKNGDYVDYVTFETLRVTPYLVNTSSDPDVVMNEVFWEPTGDMPNGGNQTYQKFYIFYKGNPPSNTTIETQVRNYLLDLHSHCHPQTEDSNGSVIYIGHGDSINEKKAFLAKMYPNLFSVSTLDVIPIINTAMIGSNPWDQTAYMQPITLQKILNTLRQVPDYNQFRFNEEGKVGVNDFTFPVEVLHIGGDKDVDNNGSEFFSYNFPVICSTTALQGVEQNPLTSIKGFENYHQKTFGKNDVPASNGDKFQFILCMLFIKMFINDLNKPHYETIAGIPVKYERDTLYDKTVPITCYNVAKFSLNSVEFRVFSQVGKTFGSITRVESI